MSLRLSGLFGSLGLPLRVGESTLMLGSFSKSGQQQTLALIQVVRQEGGVIHYAHCCSDFYRWRKSALEKYLTHAAIPPSQTPRSRIESR